MPVSKKTFWPYGILLSILAIVCACVVTIVIASKHPVYEDDFYFDSYQNVENNFNEIQKLQANFDKSFNLNLKLPSKIDKNKKLVYLLDKNTLDLALLAKEKLTKNPQITLKLTRPHTTAQDLDLKYELVKTNQGFLIKTSFENLEQGRWQLKVKISIDNKAGFFVYELYKQA